MSRLNSINRGTTHPKPDAIERLLDALCELLPKGADTYGRKALLRAFAMEPHHPQFSALPVVALMDQDRYQDAVLEWCRQEWKIAYDSDAPSSALAEIAKMEERLSQQSGRVTKPLQVAFDAYWAMYEAGQLTAAEFESRAAMLRDDARRAENGKLLSDGSDAVEVHRGRPPSASVHLGRELLGILMRAGFGDDYAKAKHNIKAAMRHAQEFTKACHAGASHSGRELVLNDNSLRESATNIRRHLSG